MFLGTYLPRLDEKGRLILPAKYRDELAGGLVITKGRERCLTVWPLAAFREMTDHMAKSQLGLDPNISRADRDYARVLFASASNEVPDRQGRVTIPPALRTYAGLTRDCAVIGTNDHVEIWDAGAWDSYLAQQEQAYAEPDEPASAGDGVTPS